MRLGYDTLCKEVIQLRKDMAELQKLCRGLLRPKSQSRRATQRSKLEIQLRQMVERSNQKLTKQQRKK